MRAAFYERTGSPSEVLQVRDLPGPTPGPGEVRVRVAFSGVNPSDVKSRRGAVTSALAYPRIIPHSDGSGIIDQVGSDVDSKRLGEWVWIWNSAWVRADGTAAELITVELELVTAVRGEILVVTREGDGWHGVAPIVPYQRQGIIIARA
jgi:NADPH2:quinone reductase